MPYPYKVGFRTKLTLDDYPMVVLYYWDVSGPQPKQLFSVASSNQKMSVKARAIVTHTGTDAYGGEWICSKDGKDLALCTHVRLAETYLKDLLGGLSDLDGEINEDTTGIPLNIGEIPDIFCDNYCVLTRR